MKDIEEMNQDELYEFLIKCGATNIKKVSLVEEAEVYINENQKRIDLVYLIWYTSNYQS